MRLRINRKRALRQLLWIPCILVCISALFAPETAGVASRLLSDRTVYWGQHRIRIPLNWVIDHNEDADFSAMTAPGSVGSDSKDIGVAKFRSQIWVSFQSVIQKYTLKRMFHRALTPFSQRIRFLSATNR